MLTILKRTLVFLPVAFVIMMIGLKASAVQPTKITPVDTSTSWKQSNANDGVTLNKRHTKPIRVRIGMKLTPITRIVTNVKNGQKTKFVSEQTLRHTLRARLERTNHFYIGDYHVETKPLKWTRKTKQYTVRLNMYRRYGSFGQLEEKIGHVDVAGVLVRQNDGLFIQKGVSSKRMRNKLGHPVLDLAAGYGTPKAPMISKKSKTTRRKL